MRASWRSKKQTASQGDINRHIRAISSRRKGGAKARPYDGVTARERVGKPPQEMDPPVPKVT